MEDNGGSFDSSEDREQRSEVRGQRSEVRGQKSEVRGQKSIELAGGPGRMIETEVKGQKSEDTSQAVGHGQIDL